MTSGVQALALAVLNSALGVAVAFGAPISATQVGQIYALGNAVALLIVGITVKHENNGPAG